jgi:hypothetical protein
MNRSSQVRVFGLIPAAGWSRRMGKPKQLLPWGRATILETVMDTVGAGGVDGLVVVTHSRIVAALDLTSTWGYPLPYSRGSVSYNDPLPYESRLGFSAPLQSRLGFSAPLQSRLGVFPLPYSRGSVWFRFGTGMVF